MGQIVGYISNQEWRNFDWFYSQATNLYFGTDKLLDWPDVIYDTDTFWPDVIEDSIKIAPTELSLTIYMRKIDDFDHHNFLILDREAIDDQDYTEDAHGYVVTLRALKYMAHLYK